MLYFQYLSGQIEISLILLQCKTYNVTHYIMMRTVISM